MNASSASRNPTPRILLYAACGAALAACGGGKKLHFMQEGIEASPQPQVDGEPFFEVAWRHDLGGDFSAENNAIEPIVSGSVVFAAGPSGRVSALGADDGTPLWTTDLDRKLSAGVGLGDGLVLVASVDGEVIALHRENGVEAWRTATGGEVLAQPVVAPGVVIVREGDGRVLGLDSATGAVTWDIRTNLTGLSVRGVSTPLIDGRGAVVGFADGELLALDIDSGRILWETGIGSRRGDNRVEQLADVDSDPVLIDGILYVAAFRSRLAAVSLETSTRLLWSAELSILHDFASDAERLYAVTETGGVRALNRLDGEVLWSQDALAGRGVSPPVSTPGMVLVGDYTGMVYRIDAASGELSAAQKLSGGAVVAPPVKDRDRILFLTENGRLIATTPR